MNVQVVIAALVALLVGFGAGTFYGHTIAARLLKKAQATPEKK